MTTKRIILIFSIGLVLLAAVFPFSYWINAQPVVVVNHKTVDKEMLLNTPEKNIQIINYIEAKGKTLAPNYKETVCTEFVIKVINHFNRLSASEKKALRIITTEKLDSLVLYDAPIIKGVQTALIQGNKGHEIDKIENVRPVDFFQFWNIYQNLALGHCGVVLEIEPYKSITAYSSHPMTGGYGKQKYLWPDKIYFAKLK